MQLFSFFHAQQCRRPISKLGLKGLFVQTLITAFFLLATIVFPSAQNARGEETAKSSPPEIRAELTLVQAVLCENLKDLEPEGQSIVFSAKLGDVICFTFFDPVPEKTEIYHKWFKRDQLDAEMKLVLKPPKWSTFSKVRIHSADAGPWRVEITDQNGKILKILRFSVTE